MAAESRLVTFGPTAVPKALADAPAYRFNREKEEMARETLTFEAASATTVAGAICIKMLPGPASTYTILQFEEKWPSMIAKA